jgi:hypothetical protein
MNTFYYETFHSGRNASPHHHVHKFISKMALTALLVPRNRNVPEQPEGHSDFPLAVSIVDLRETYY